MVEKMSDCLESLRYWAAVFRRQTGQEWGVQSDDLMQIRCVYTSENFMSKTRSEGYTMLVTISIQKVQPSVITISKPDKRFKGTTSTTNACNFTLSGHVEFQGKQVGSKDQHLSDGTPSATGNRIARLPRVFR